jgi:hypothetical protein
VALPGARWSGIVGSSKVKLGEALLERLEKGTRRGARLLGARPPRGARAALRPADTVISPSVAAALDRPRAGARLDAPEKMAFPAAQLGRRTGDRARDVDDAVRERLAARLRSVPGGERTAGWSRRSSPSRRARSGWPSATPCPPVSGDSISTTAEQARATLSTRRPGLATMVRGDDLEELVVAVLAAQRGDVLVGHLVGVLARPSRARARSSSGTCPWRPLARRRLGVPAR